jgi:dihydropteroate synthase
VAVVTVAVAADVGAVADVAAVGEAQRRAGRRTRSDRRQETHVALVLGSRVFEPAAPVVMAIVNRTPDSFFDAGATFALDAALARVAEAVDEGADVVDIGGVRAGSGEYVSVAEELARTAELVTQVRAAFPRLVISVDTWRAEVADELCRRGADLLNDTWAGADPDLAGVAGRHGVGLVCSHTGGLPPRTDPHRVAYVDVVADVVASTSALAERAVAQGVRSDAILVDPTHDFGKNTWHSLELTRRLDELVATGWPVLVALSNKDFVGETLDLPVQDRLSGTLAATAVCAWHGARVFRAHDVAATRQVVDMVASIRGLRPPARAVRGLA